MVDVACADGDVFILRDECKICGIIHRFVRWIEDDLWIVGNLGGFVEAGGEIFYLTDREIFQNRKIWRFLIFLVVRGFLV